MKTDLFQSCGHCWVYHICWHIECSTFTASSFRIWVNSTGIPSLPLALFVVMLSKMPGAGILHIECTLHIAYWVQHFPQHHLSGSGIAQLEFYHCREPAWGAPPMTKVMKKEARHTQRRDRASGVPLEILEHLPPKPESAYFLLYALTYTSDFTRGCPPLPLSEKKS